MCKTPQKILEATKRWQVRNPKHLKDYRKRQVELGLSKKYYHKNREKFLQKNAEYTEQLRIKALILYGGKCKKCGISNPIFLALDHVGNDGYKTKSRNYSVWKKIFEENDKSKYQVLCHNHNWEKHINNLKNKKYGQKRN